MQRLLLVIPVLVLACGDSGVVGDSAPSSGGIATPEVVGETAPSSEVTVTHTEQGSGPSPAATDVVVVHCHGTFPDGEVFDSSVDRGEPARFPLNRVIPCWTEAVQQMKVGGKAQLVCPPESAYGAQGAGPIPPNSTLHFDVELLGIQ